MNARVSDILAQGKRLVRAAAAQTGDLNEAHLLVHGVVSRALLQPANDQDADLDNALQNALSRWRAVH